MFAETACRPWLDLVTVVMHQISREPSRHRFALLHDRESIISGSRVAPPARQGLSCSARPLALAGSLTKLACLACSRPCTIKRADDELPQSTRCICTMPDPRPTGLVWLGAGLIYRVLLSSRLTPLRSRATKERRRLRSPAHRIVCTYLPRDKDAPGARERFGDDCPLCYRIQQRILPSHDAAPGSSQS